jgi:hypothetical protein
MPALLILEHLKALYRSLALKITPLKLSLQRFDIFLRIGKSK